MGCFTNSSYEALYWDGYINSGGVSEKGVACLELFVDERDYPANDDEEDRIREQAVEAC